MKNTIKKKLEKIYKSGGLTFSDYFQEIESKEYDASRFLIDGKQVICRKSKVTPTKLGQFVTCWKRKGNGPIEPFEQSDNFDFLVINVQAANKLGQFVFPKSVLIDRGIISSSNKEGKRGFRVYPVWDIPISAQAKQTQKWQLNSFFKIDRNIDINAIKELYSKN